MTHKKNIIRFSDTNFSAVFYEKLRNNMKSALKWCLKLAKFFEALWHVEMMSLIIIGIVKK